MSAEAAADRHREVVAAAQVDPILWDMNSDLIELRRQLADLRRTLEQRERHLVEARHGSEGSQRAVRTLNAVLTEMVLKGRVELQAARDEAKRAAAERLRTARAEADLLVADASAAVATAVSRPVDEPNPTGGAAWPWETAAPTSTSDLSPSDPGPPVTSRAPVEADYELSPPPSGLRPPPPAAGPGRPGPRPPVGPPPPEPLRSGPFPSPPPADPRGHSPMNGADRPTAVRTLDVDLDEQFHQVVGLPPNTEFRTPPRGTPAVRPERPPADDRTRATAPVLPPAPTPVSAPTPAGGRSDEDFSSFWRHAEPTGDPAASVSPRVSGRLPPGVLDALLPIIAVILVVIVLLSWLG